jgi:hypothetical protein
MNVNRSIQTSEDIPETRIPALDAQQNMLEDSSAGFWNPQSIDTLSFLHLTPVVSDIRSLAVDFWPSDESADDINAFISSRRHKNPANR